ncbi:hypothetical protein [Hymenobacter jejuensis]|uniref:Uncharacterized protein n=1 Tax=Hymenobacter jejuensis TaxID=2502781 RepID=A0A5B8A435_9BACT|nr:hypothetical protein [Hymenobacter jejuensis]QDA62007.1 hypothetical protein FHG12_18710 [Hymenobacter jejuensis]
MAISTRAWTSIGAALAGLVVGLGLAATFRPRTPFTIDEEIRAGANVEYEDTFLNAVGFRSELRAQPNVDSVFAQHPFFRQAIRVLRRDSSGVEALSMPRPGRKENYYLIRGDSVTQLWVRPRKSR